MLAAGQLAVVVGMLHLGLGVRYWSLYAMAGSILPPDIRVPLWTISGTVLLVGVVVVVRQGLHRRRLAYWLGAALMMTYILGYFSWHLGGHRAFFIMGNARLHDTGLVTFLIDHAIAGPIETIALVTETLLLVVLGVLLHDDRDTEP